MNTECMLTTIDNPYDPYTEFDQWYLYDEMKGYHTCAYLARIARLSDAFTDVENDAATERAIDEIVRLDFQNIYKKVRRKDLKTEEEK